MEAAAAAADSGGKYWKSVLKYKYCYIDKILLNYE